jgi:hypothetical protein
MSEFPCLPLFTDAFIADTGHLGAIETGAYLMLLMVALALAGLPAAGRRSRSWRDGRASIRGHGGASIRRGHGEFGRIAGWGMDTGAIY